MHALRHSAYPERCQRTKRPLGRQRGAKVAQIDIAPKNSPKRSGKCSPATSPSVRLPLREAPLSSGRLTALVDAEVVGDDLHVQEPKDEQRESDHADECEHNQDEARKSVGREVSRATWQPPALCGRRGRLGGHPIRILRRRGRLRLGLDAGARGDVLDRPRGVRSTAALSAATCLVASHVAADRWRAARAIATVAADLAGNGVPREHATGPAVDSVAEGCVALPRCSRVGVPPLSGQSCWPQGQLQPTLLASHAWRERVRCVWVGSRGSCDSGGACSSSRIRRGRCARRVTRSNKTQARRQRDKRHSSAHARSSALYGAALRAP